MLEVRYMFSPRNPSLARFTYALFTFREAFSQRYVWYPLLFRLWNISWKRALWKVSVLCWDWYSSPHWFIIVFKWFLLRVVCTLGWLVMDPMRALLNQKWSMLRKSSPWPLLNWTNMSLLLTHRLNYSKQNLLFRVFPSNFMSILIGLRILSFCARLRWPVFSRIRDGAILDAPNAQRSFSGMKHLSLVSCVIGRTLRVY